MLYSNVLSKLMYKCIKKVPVTVVKTEFLKHFSKQMSVYLPYIVLKHCNLPDNLNFKGKIFAKFLIRSHFLEIYCNITTS